MSGSSALEVDVSVPSDSTHAIVVDVSDGTQLNFALPLEAATVDGELANDGSTTHHGIAVSAAIYTVGVEQNSNPKRCLQLTIISTIITAPIPYFDLHACR